MNGRGQRVCVLAPIGRDARLSVEMLQGEGIDAVVCDTVDDLCRSITDEAGALLVAEEALRPDALRMLVDCLDQQPPWSDIAVIVLAGSQFTSSSERPLTVLGPLRNVTILERPVRRLILSRTVSIALRGRRRQLELRAYLDERAELLRREQLANRMKDEFLMTVSHELRTPLTSIYGWARMLVTGQIREDQKRRAIETIERNAQAQTQLVNDLLDVSRAISGKVRLDIQSVDLSQVVLAAVDSMQPAADAKGIDLQTILDPDAGPISGDRDRMQQVVWNLLSNAIKFTPMVAGRDRRQRHGKRHRPRIPAARLRSLPSGRLGHDAAARRSRAGPGDRATSRGAARRIRAGGKPRRRGRDDVPRADPADDCGARGRADAAARADRRRTRRLAVAPARRPSRAGRGR